MFKLPDTGNWGEVNSHEWKREGCVPIYRKPQNTWDDFPSHRKETIWFIPELFFVPDPDSVHWTEWILCIWDSQAGRWVALPSPSGMKIGKTDTAIAAGSSGVVSIWTKAGGDTNLNVTAHLDWMHNSEDLALGTEVLLAWFPDEELWRIVGRECP